MKECAKFASKVQLESTTLLQRTQRMFLALGVAYTASENILCVGGFAE